MDPETYDKLAWLCITLVLMLLSFAAGAWTMGFYLTSGVN